MIRSTASDPPAGWRGAVAASRRRLIWMADLARPGGRLRVRFRCNVCGTYVSAATRRMQREVPSCVSCGSTIRTRAFLDVFGREVLGCRDTGSDFPLRPEIVGIGVSDQAIHAKHFSRTTTYVNTWFHQQPYRDLMRPETFGADRYDYVTCSEVLEHVDQPAEVALRTIFGVLKPGGVVVLTTPTAEGTTTEHYPALIEREAVPTATGWQLHGRGRDGAVFVSDSVVFHGGPGATVEMRVWGSESLYAALAAAGFQDIRRHMADVPELGIEWSGIPESMSVPGGVARGLRSGVWTARRPNGEQG